MNYTDYFKDIIIIFFFKVTDVKMILNTNLAPRKSFSKSAWLCGLQFLSYYMPVKCRIKVLNTGT